MKGRKLLQTWQSHGMALIPPEAKNTVVPQNRSLDFVDKLRAQIDAYGAYSVLYVVTFIEATNPRQCGR